jgi:hypothetical protein
MQVTKPLHRILYLVKFVPVRFRTCYPLNVIQTLYPSTAPTWGTYYLNRDVVGIRLVVRRDILPDQLFMDPECSNVSKLYH